MVCWGENINAGDAGRGRTNKLVIKAVFVAGLSLNTLEALAQERRRRRTKLNSNLDYPLSSCPFYHALTELQSIFCFVPPRCNTGTLIFFFLC